LLKTGKGASAETQKLRIVKLVDVMGWKAVGNKLIDKKQVEMEWERKDGPPTQSALFE